jgi:hypothetical protein
MAGPTAFSFLLVAALREKRVATRSSRRSRPTCDPAHVQRYGGDACYERDDYRLRGARRVRNDDGYAALRSGRTFPDPAALATRRARDAGGRLSRKTWRIDVSGDPGIDTRFALVVTYRITCER